MSTVQLRHIMFFFFKNRDSQGKEEMQTKTLEELSQEAAKFLDEKPSHKRSRTSSKLHFSDFHILQVCQHLVCGHHGFGSVHLWILLLDFELVLCGHKIGAFPVK